MTFHRLQLFSGCWLFSGGGGFYIGFTVGFRGADALSKRPGRGRDAPVSQRGSTALLAEPNPPAFSYMCLAPNDPLIPGNRPPSRTEDVSAPYADCDQGTNEGKTVQVLVSLRRLGPWPTNSCAEPARSRVLLRAFGLVRGAEGEERSELRATVNMLRRVRG